MYLRPSEPRTEHPGPYAGLLHLQDTGRVTWHPSQALQPQGIMMLSSLS